jgi:hypothetical protein
MVDKNKIEQIKKNIFPHSVNAIEDYYEFDWHQYKRVVDTDKINSSQAVVIDVFGLLKLSPNKDIIINKIFNKNGTEWNILFEYINSTLLNESQSKQIDIVISDKQNIILLESKFMENDSGTCSQPKEQCNGNYEEQINPKNNIKCKCALTAKGIKYWGFIPQIYKFDPNANYYPCPFKLNQYQFMRNLCFGKALSLNENKNVENYFIYYESEICPIYKKIKNNNYLIKLTENLHDKNILKILTYNNLIIGSQDVLKNIDIDEYKKWKELEIWLNEKIVKYKNQGNFA